MEFSRLTKKSSRPFEILISEESVGKNGVGDNNAGVRKNRRDEEEEEDKK